MYEKQANSFASSLLLPGSFVKPFIARNDLTWELIKEVADKCEASLQATAWRLVTLAKEEYSLIIQYSNEVWIPIKSPSCHHFVERNKFSDYLLKTEIVNDRGFPSSWDECEATEWIDSSPQLPSIKYSAISYPEYGLTMTILYMPEVDGWEEEGDTEWTPPSF
uniref:Uncharacterized protein n=1 Tax=uncultured Thiotrichaceae bacterium TaxID=298394 RepID=A0A6S6SE39_9GAMM|nr:MAG: Unknown protein [uncultured Thiotrichaceae bacterium]